MAGSARILNRGSEVRSLLRAVAPGQGNIVLLTGPPGGGKTTIIQETLQQMRENKLGYPIYINMRTGSFSSAKAFAQEIKSSFPDSLSVLRTLNKVVEAWEPKDPLHRVIKPILGYMTDVSEQGETSDIETLLRCLTKTMKSWRSRWLALENGIDAGYPTLFIDEADKLHEWLYKAGEESNFRLLKDWLNRVSRDEKLANIVISSSDDFFHQWIAENMFTRPIVHVVCDLDATEARAFLTSKVGREIPANLWSRVYEYLGGRIHLLDVLAKELQYVGEEEQWKFWEEYERSMRWWTESQMEMGFKPEKLRKKWRIDSTELDIGKDLNQKRRTSFFERLVSLFVKQELPVEEQTPDPLKPQWTPEQYNLVLHKLTAVDRRGGLSLKDLCKVVPEKSVMSLITYNMLHLRHQGRWEKEDHYDGNWPVIMFQDSPAYHAARMILRPMSKESDRRRDRLRLRLSARSLAFSAMTRNSKKKKDQPALIAKQGREIDKLYAAARAMWKKLLSREYLLNKLHAVLIKAFKRPLDTKEMTEKPRKTRRRRKSKAASTLISPVEDGTDLSAQRQRSPGTEERENEKGKAPEEASTDAFSSKRNAGHLSERKTPEEIPVVDIGSRLIHKGRAAAQKEQSSGTEREHESVSCMTAVVDSLSSSPTGEMPVDAASLEEGSTPTPVQAATPDHEEIARGTKQNLAKSATAPSEEVHDVNESTSSATGEIHGEAALLTPGKEIDAPTRSVTKKHAEASLPTPSKEVDVSTSSKHA